MSGVVHVITCLERGGAQRNTLETVAQLHRPDRPQWLISGPRGALDDEARQRLGSRFVTLPALQNRPSLFKDTEALLALARHIELAVERLRPPVVVHTHSSKAGVLGRLAARGVRGAFTVHTVHGFGLEALGPSHRWLLEAAERVAAPAGDFFVFVSEADRDHALHLGLCAPARALTIRSGINEGPFSAVHSDGALRKATRERLGLQPKTKVAVTVANMKPQKDPLFHIDVFAAWRKMVTDAALVFVGDGPLRAAAEERARAVAVDDAIRFVGFVDDTRPYLAAADVFLLASAWEGLPRSVLEATAAGLPCVVRDSGWAADVSFARSIRALPASAAAEAFAAALMGPFGPVPKKLPAAFTERGMLRELRALYDEICGPPAPTPRRRQRR